MYIAKHHKKKIFTFILSSILNIILPTQLLCQQPSLLQEALLTFNIKDDLGQFDTLENNFAKLLQQPGYNQARLKDLHIILINHFANKANKLLGLTQPLTQANERALYKAALLRYHPDKNPNTPENPNAQKQAEELFKEIKAGESFFAYYIKNPQLFEASRKPQAPSQPTQTPPPTQAYQPALDPVIAMLMQKAKDGTITQNLINKQTKKVLVPIINTQDGEGKTLAHYLALSNKRDILYWLLDQYNTSKINNNAIDRVKINIRDKNGNTPFDYLKDIDEKTLKYTIRWGDIHTNMIRRLAKRGLNFFAHGNQPLFWAIDHPWSYLVPGILQALLDSITNQEEKKIIVNEIQDNETPLHKATEYKEKPIMEVLLNNGADPKVNTLKGTPLHRTVSGRYFFDDLAKMLINAVPADERLAYINIKNSDGKTARDINVEMSHTFNQPKRIGAFDDLIKELTQSAQTHTTTGPTPQASSPKNPAQALGDTLFQAAIGGKTQDVLALIEQGANAKAKDNNGNTPLHGAALNGRTETALALIDKRADVNAKNNDGNTPLYFAVGIGHTKTALALINKGADVNAKNNNGSTPLHSAALNGRTETALALINIGADVNAKNNNGNTPLYWALGNGHTETALALINKGANVNAKNNVGNTPLHWAAQKGHTKTTLALINKRADINTKDFLGATPLHLSVINTNNKPDLQIQLIQTLITNKANINDQMLDGHTPLHLAVIAGNKPAIKELVAQGASLNLRANPTLKDTLITILKPKQLNEPPNITTLRGQLQKRYATEQNQQMDYSQGLTPLELLNTMNYKQELKDEIAKLLTPPNPPLDIFHAAAQGDLDAVNVLLKQGSDVSQSGPYGNTPLHYAAMNGNELIIEALSNAANPENRPSLLNKQNNQGFTPLHLAVDRDNAAAVRMLLQYEANPAVTDSDYNTPLHYAAKKGFTHLIIDLINAFPKNQRLDYLTFRNTKGKTAAENATDKSHFETAKIIFKAINELSDIPIPPIPFQSSPLIPLEEPTLFPEMEQEQQQPQREPRGVKRTRDEYEKI